MITPKSIAWATYSVLKLPVSGLAGTQSGHDNNNKNNWWYIISANMYACILCFLNNASSIYWMLTLCRSLSNHFINLWNNPLRYVLLPSPFLNEESKARNEVGWEAEPLSFKPRGSLSTTTWSIHSLLSLSQQTSEVCTVLTLLCRRRNQGTRGRNLVKWLSQ